MALSGSTGGAFNPISFTGYNYDIVLETTAGKRIVIRTTAAHDVDLYVQLGAAPTTSAYLARAYTTSGAR